MNTFNESQIKEIYIAFDLLCSDYYTEGRSEGVDLYRNDPCGTIYVDTFDNCIKAMKHALLDLDPEEMILARDICFYGVSNLDDYVAEEIEDLQHRLEQQKNYLNKAMRTSSNYLYRGHVDPSLLDDAYRLSRSLAAHASSIKSITKKIVLMRKLELILKDV